MELSEDAKKLCVSWFLNGEKCTVKSSPPHRVANLHRAALDELLAAGVVTSRPFNNYGVVEYLGTPKAKEIAWPIFQAQMLESFGPESK